jgi:hypothetical protein
MIKAYVTFFVIWKLIACKESNLKLIIDICKFVALNWICQCHIEKRGQDFKQAGADHFPPDSSILADYGFCISSFFTLGALLYAPCLISLR